MSSDATQQETINCNKNYKEWMKLKEKDNVSKIGTETILQPEAILNMKS